MTLGLPEDSPSNLAQSNRADGELRYWRELPGGREMTVGVGGARFDADAFDDARAGTRRSRRRRRLGFRPSFTEGGGYAELRNPIFGEDHAIVLRGSVRHRSFDAISEGDHLDAAGLLGLEEPAAGRGRRSSSPAATAGSTRRASAATPHALGRAELGWRHERSGLRFRLGFHHEITPDLRRQRFIDTTGRLSIEKYFGLQHLGDGDRVRLAARQRHAHPSTNLFGGAEVVVRRQLSRSFQISVAYRYWENGGDFELDDFQQNQASLSFSYRH